MLAEQVLVGGHADDRLMLAAVRTARDELVAAQAVDAPVTARKLGRAKPWLAASRTARARQDRLLSHHAERHRKRAMKKPLVRSRCGSSCKKRPSRREASRGC